MASRIRDSPAHRTPNRSAAPSTSARGASDALPPYKKPSHPLDADATRQLRALQGRNLDDVKRHNKTASETVSASTAMINDQLRGYTEYIARRQKKWDAGKSLETREEEEQILRDFEVQVNEATAKLEESMRAVIDSTMAAQRIDEALDWLRQNAPRQLEDEYNTQMTQRATQRQSQIQSQNRRQSGQDEDEDEDMDEGPTPGPTPLDGSRVALTGASEMFATRIQRSKDEYTSLSLTARYARNNTYRDYKALVHDARFGDDAPPLGHEDTWFTETGSPAPGVTNMQRGDFDDEDDIVINKEKISTRCPITFQHFIEPYTSRKCPHTFEKNAILELIRTSGRNQGHGVKEIGCPVGGCPQMLSAADLRSDPVLIRKIKRMQQADAEANEESSDEEDDDDGDAPPPRREVKPTLSGKSTDSHMSVRPRVPASQQPPRSSIIEDLGGPSDEDGADDHDEEV